MGKSKRYNFKNNEDLNNIFNKNVKYLLKDLDIDRYYLCDKLNISYSSFCNKITNCGAKFNLYEMLSISNELGEYIEDLCRIDFLEKIYRR